MYESDVKGKRNRAGLERGVSRESVGMFASSLELRDLN